MLGNQPVAKYTPTPNLHLQGKIGNLVFCHLPNGTAYVRAFTPPRNPDTTEQRKARSRFRNAVAAWKALPPDQKAEYRLRAIGLPGSGYHLFLSEQLAPSTPNES